MVKSLNLIRGYASELRRRRAASDSDLWLCEPILNCEVDEVRAMPLLNWIYFNPFGPTNSTLMFIPVPGTEEGILFFHADNPFQRDRAAFAAIPMKVAAEDLCFIAVDLMAQNGHESCPILGGLPSSVAHADNWDLDVMAPYFDAEQARILFRVALRNRNTDLRMKSAVEFLSAYPDPWERTAAEYDQALLRFLVRTEETTNAFDPVLFERWFDLVSDPEHLRIERNNFHAAWQGAIEQVEKARANNAKQGDMQMRAERLKAFMKRMENKQGRS